MKIYHLCIFFLLAVSCNKMKSMLTLQAKNKLSAQLSSRISTSSTMETYLQEETAFNRLRQDGAAEAGAAAGGDGAAGGGEAGGDGAAGGGGEGGDGAAGTGGEGGDGAGGDGVKEESAAKFIEDLAVQKQGWLMVSSQSYMDPMRFPTVRGREKNTFKMVEMVDGYVSVAEEGASEADQAPGSYFRKNTVFPKEGIPAETKFYFRLSKNNLYYTASQKEMVVLGAIAITNIEQVSQADSSFMTGYCIQVKDAELDQWVLCASSEKEIKDWQCAIYTQLGIPCKEETVEDTIKVAQPVFVVSTPSPYCNDGWDYQEHGEDWQCLCQEGRMQSPIDIKLLCKVPGVMTPENRLNQSAIFQFQAVQSSDYQMVWEDHMVKMVCKGACKSPLARVIDVDYSEFESHQLEFHTPSDHTMNGQRYPMEIQAVFKPVSQQAFREKLVISWLVQNVPGGSNEFISKLDLLDLPNKKMPVKEVAKEDKELNLQGMFLNDEVAKFYDSFSYYYYSGSLTSPQCDENVRWIVASDPMPLGISIFQMFNDANGKHNLKYKGNNRAIQQSNGRSVTFFDAEASGCGKPKEKKSADEGHFEHLDTKLYNLYFLDGQQPSGLKTSKPISDEKIQEIRQNSNNLPLLSKILKGAK